MEYFSTLATLFSNCLFVTASKPYKETKIRHIIKKFDLYSSLNSKLYLTIEAMLIWKLFILAIAESATLRQILNLPTVKRGGSEPLYNYQFGRVLSLVNRKNDLASRLTVTKKIKMGQPLRNMLSVISPKPTHKSNRRRIPAKRSSSRFNHFRKYHSK